MQCDGKPLKSLGHGICEAIMLRHEVIGNVWENKDLLK